MFYRYQEYTDGVQKCLEGLNIECYRCRDYISLKRIPFDMNCYQCGHRSNVLIMDTTCKVALISLTTAHDRSKNSTRTQRLHTSHIKNVMLKYVSTI